MGLQAGGVLVHGLGSPVGVEVLGTSVLVVFGLAGVRLVVVPVGVVVPWYFCVRLLLIDVNVMLGEDGGFRLLKPEEEGLVLVFLHLLDVCAIFEEIPIPAVKQGILLGVGRARDFDDDGEAAHFLLGRVAVVIEMFEGGERVSGGEDEVGSRRGFGRGCIFVRDVGRFGDDDLQDDGMIELVISLMDGIGGRIYRIRGISTALRWLPGDGILCLIRAAGPDKS